MAISDYLYNTSIYNPMSAYKYNPYTNYYDKPIYTYDPRQKQLAESGYVPNTSGDASRGIGKYIDNSNTLSAVGGLTPVLGAAGAAIGIGGAVSDYFAKKKAENDMKFELDKIAAKRSQYENLYRRDLLNNIDMKNLQQSGQLDRIPGYKTMLSNAAKENEINNINTLDALNRKGMYNSGLASYINNANTNAINNNILSNLYNKNYIGASNLGNFAGDITPYQTNYNKLSGDYSDYNNFGQNFQGIGSLINEYNNQQILNDRLKQQKSTFQDYLRRYGQQSARGV